MNRCRNLVSIYEQTSDSVIDDFKDKLNETLEKTIADSFIQCGKTRLAMFYKCESCKNLIVIWLERGLEEYNGKYHKPVPFSVPCPKCGGFHMDHVMWENDIHLKHDAEIPNNSYYFANLSKYDCGILKRMDRK